MLQFFPRLKKETKKMMMSPKRFALLLLLLMAKVKCFTVRVMTYNSWLMGTNVNNGTAKAVEMFRYVDPDILLLQEITDASAFQELLNNLGPPYHGIMSRSESFPINGILSKFPVVDSHTNLFYGVHAKIRVAALNSQMNLSVWNVHFQNRSYGPYAACNKWATDTSQLLAGEIGAGYSHKYPGRLQNVQYYVNHPTFQKALGKVVDEPILFGGTLNSPSHDDWVASTMGLHCGWEFAWPVPRILSQIGFIDSFRTVHPDPVEVPGNTWSTVHKFTGPDWGWTIAEPQDRIDYIFFKGSRISPTVSKVFMGEETIKHAPYHEENHWSSDHAAVVTEFALPLD